MAEAITTVAAPAAIGASGIVLATILPGVDLNAVIGAFGGAFCFVIFAKNISIWQRFFYLLAGWVGGYAWAGESAAQSWLKTSLFSSYVAGLLCVTVCMSVLEAIETGKMPRWITFLFNRLVGRGDKQ